MKRYPHIMLFAALVASLAVGSVQGCRLRHLREAEAFYRWLLAAATHERLFRDAAGEYSDKELFDAVGRKIEPDIAGWEVDDDEADEDVSTLSRVAGDRRHDRALWNYARSRTLQEERGRFLQLARERKLSYARDIDYAEAQAGGVNLFNLFFGFRKVAANFVWIQVDRYWHQGMMYRMIPLMKTCVLLDPNFIDAYLLGAWHLSYNATAKMPDTPPALKKWHPKYQVCLGEKELYYYLAIDFLKDGIGKNPRNYKLYFDLGFAVYKNKLNDYPNAVRYLREAVRQPHDRWVPRQLYICMELNGQYAEALAGWQDYMKRFPGSDAAQEVAPRFVQRNTALIYEQRAEEAFAAVASAVDPQEAGAKRQEATEYEQRAIQIWNEMNEPFAEYRLARLHALDLVEEGRYMEAVAMLDKARWENPANFDAASDLMIEIKLRGGLPLSVSEKKAVLRREAGDICQGMPEDIRRQRLEEAEAAGVQHDADLLDSLEDGSHSSHPGL